MGADDSMTHAQERAGHYKLDHNLGEGRGTKSAAAVHHFLSEIQTIYFSIDRFS
jgi:hypothetical protein